MTLPPRVIAKILAEAFIEMYDFPTLKGVLADKVAAGTADDVDREVMALIESGEITEENPQ